MKKVFEPYEPIEFEYKGETYQVKYPLTVELMKSVDEDETKAAEGDLGALTSQLIKLTTITEEKAREVDFVALSGILRYCHDEIENRILAGTGKNVSRPSEKKQKK